MANLLVVEEEIEVLCAIRMLQESRFPDINLYEARNVETFWSVFESQKYDAILLDLRLPPNPRTMDIDNMAGVIIAEELERRNQNVPIVVLTAWPEAGDWRQRLERIKDVRRIFKKPISWDELFEALQEAMKQAQQSKEVKK